MLVNMFKGMCLVLTLFVQIWVKITNSVLPMHSAALWNWFNDLEHN